MFEGYDVGNGMIEPSRYMLSGDVSRTWRYECDYDGYATIVNLIDVSTPTIPDSFHQAHVRSV